MTAMARTDLWKTLRLYLVPGILIGGVKLASIFAWFLAASIGQVGSNYVAGDFVGILLMGLGGTAISIIGWPLVIFNLLTGKASLSAVLFFPWVTTL